MTILKLLSEEIFDFSQGEMTQVCRLQGWEKGFTPAGFHGVRVLLKERAETAAETAPGSGWAASGPSPLPLDVLEVLLLRQAVSPSVQARQAVMCVALCPQVLLPLPLLLQAKTRELKQNLNNEFRSIHELCMFVLANTRKVELLRATLTALAAYLSWIPPGACCCSAGPALGNKRRLLPSHQEQRRQQPRCLSARLV